MMALVTLFTALNVAPAVATEDDPEVAHVDHEHVAEEEQYMLDASSSAPGAVFFNESSGCGERSGAMTPATTTDSTANRSIPSGHQVRGPWGDFFGRDYSDVNGSMVDWTVPMSGGTKVKVHKRALPAFQQVSANLAARKAEGKHYDVRIAASWVWRRIGGSYRMSTHSFGTTIDINWDTNPYRSDAKLVTDMPKWFVDAWRDAGFCWGGDWLRIKDAMHFSWMGPAATDGYGTLPKPYAPNTARAAFTDIAYTSSSGFPNAAGGDFVIADGNGDGAPDLVRLREYGADGMQISFARSSKNFRRCGVSSYTARGAAGADAFIFADRDGDSRPDLWALDTSGSRLSVEAFTFASGFDSSSTLATSVVPRSGASYLVGDYNRDGKGDLYVVTPGATTRVEVWSGAGKFATRLVDASVALDTRGAWQFSVGDDDVDGKDDVVAIDASGTVRLRTLRAADKFATAVASSTGATATDGDHFAMGDLDGDGRPDLWQVSSAGKVTVRRGGNSTLPVAYWYQTPDWTCAGLTPADPWDFNGDSFHDVVLGAPLEDIDTVINAGAVNVLYGSKDGVTPEGDDLLYQDLDSIEGLSEKGDRFGMAVTSADFNHDGYADLAIAAPRDDVGSIRNAGLVNVVMGTEDGLGTDGGQLWHRDVASVAGTAREGDRFGAALAAGDFNGDGYRDLAIGAPGDTVDGVSGAGSVNVLYGSHFGPAVAGNQLWSQSSSGILGAVGSGDRFGAALATGDFNGDGYDDLVVGAPGDEVGGADGAGQIHVIYGSKNGLTATFNALFHQDSTDILEAAGAGDRFGAALAVADFDGDGRLDIAVGAPGEDSGDRDSVGKVHVLFSSTGGISARGNELWYQDSDGVGSRANRGDRFGSALAAADFNDDGFGDLAVGVPGEDFEGQRNTGAVNVLIGGPGGLRAKPGNLHIQGRNGMAGTSESGDRFGATLRAIDVDGSHRWDLLIGLPGEDLGVKNAGAAFAVLGTAQGLDPARTTVWHQDAAGVSGTVEAGDGFGRM